MASYDLKAILGEKLKRLTDKTLKALVDCMCTVGASLCSLDKRVSAIESVELPEGGYKPMQEPVASPSASGTAIQFIESVSQDATGRMTATKKTIRTGSGSQTGVLKLLDSTDSTSGVDGGIAATPAAVKAVYDFASGKVDKTAVSGLADWDTLTDTGIYEIAPQASGVNNSPESGNMTLIVMKAGSFITQTAVGKEVYKRCYTSGSWTAWQRCNEFVTTYNSSTPSFAATKTAYASGADIVCIENESGQGGTFDHVARLQEVVYESGNISKFVFEISRCLNASNIGEIVKYEYASSGWTKSVSKVVESEYVRQQHENEINFKNVPATPSSGGSNISRVWFNYRNGDTDASDSGKLITEYRFGNRNGSTSGVKLVADEFSGLAASATNYRFAGQDYPIGEAIGGKQNALTFTDVYNSTNNRVVVESTLKSRMGSYMLLLNNQPDEENPVIGWGMFTDVGEEIASGVLSSSGDMQGQQFLDQIVYKAMGHDDFNTLPSRSPVLDIINVGKFSNMATDYFTMHPARGWMSQNVRREWPQRVRIRLTLNNIRNGSSGNVQIQAGGRVNSEAYFNHGNIWVDGVLTETPKSGDPREWDDGRLNIASLGSVPANGSRTWEIMYWKTSNPGAVINYNEYVVVTTIK